MFLKEGKPTSCSLPPVEPAQEKNQSSPCLVHIAVAPTNDPHKDTLGTSFDALLFNLTRARDVLDILDARLVDQYRQDEEWRSILNDL
jgi:hypothetical protein